MLSIVSLDLLTTPEKPSVQKLSSDNDYQVLTLSFAVEQSMPSHKHPNKKVMVHILTGELELASDTERSIVKRGQVAFFSGDEAHSLKNSFSGQTDIMVIVIPKST